MRTPSKKDYIKNYEVINCALKSYRTTVGSAEFKSDAMLNCLNEETNIMTEEYAAANGLDADSLKANNGSKA